MQTVVYILDSQYVSAKTRIQVGLWLLFFFLKIPFSFLVLELRRKFPN